MDLSVVLAAIGAFCVGAISLYGLLVLAAAIRKKQEARGWKEPALGLA